ncbi:MAG: quinolinate synthase NadA [Epsilonproteobacteria bacterium]|nr:quinolinate synthase NadA [Campylobacterota bacterium]OIO13417.1 MAG: quinolinate synthetase [Helicobacteraceae bacterium CG1_02_36_14]PIP09872.1 MAG: quinolinate synthase [Sulfurimonas sp. CG23_combo_of_CG06-09_8_20_14_all_36_33]PIS24088.1 MAG: quinolinate synthase NadA [Sulfurimonas sp. CG08_land_8_20_14_0_20_36_33]PIU35572.1 MAG: quinolinate synthase NadA [Sulfurimonas sp. CG07_land_8_20_14_0_80_36_56]PIV05493.1 MAG: quinolinate synthase NadA [Sulfurimonas sp. CG03_land_8_20_14_0_80_36_2
MQFTNEELKEKINALKDKLSVTVVAHFYQRDEVFEMGDITGDSLELAIKTRDDTAEFVLFCGVGFMGQSVKVLSPNKRVVMPKIACCAMARMIDTLYYDDSVKFMQDYGILKENILPITYINSNAEVKAKVGEMGGMVCTSSNAKTIITTALKEGKKILFVPDRCLGQNIANQMGLKSCVIGDGTNPIDADIICYNGFCSVHQLFTVEDIEFYRKKYPGILIATHPECDPAVCEASDFVGSTSQLIKFIKELPVEQKVAVGTEFNMVNRLREKNTYVLSSTKPECPTMNETTLEDLYLTLKAIDDGEPINEIFVDEKTQKWAKIALERMLAL